MPTDNNEEEDLDFLGDSSMLNLALRMDEIDKEIAAISEVGKEKPKTQGSGDAATAEGEREFYDTPEKSSMGKVVEDLVFEDSDAGDEEDAGLEDLQNDLKEFDASNTAPPVQPETPTSVTVTVVKPDISSSIGISMKTSKGITRVVAVNPAGLLAGSELRPGYQLIKVNSVTIRTAKHAKRVIEDTEGSVTIHALVSEPSQ